MMQCGTFFFFGGSDVEASSYFCGWFINRECSSLGEYSKGLEAYVGDKLQIVLCNIMLNYMLPFGDSF